MAQRQSGAEEEEIEEEMNEQAQTLMAAQAQRIREQQREQQEKVKPSKGTNEKDEEGRKRDKDKAEKETDKAESSMDDLKGFAKKGLSAFLSSKDQKFQEIREQVGKFDKELIKLSLKPEIDQASLEAMAKMISNARREIYGQKEGNEGKIDESIKQVQKMSIALESVSKLSELNSSPDFLKEANRAARSVGTSEENRADALIKNTGLVMEKTGTEAKKELLGQIKDITKQLEERRQEEQAQKKELNAVETPADDRKRALDSLKSEIEKSLSTLKGESRDDQAKTLADALARINRELGPEQSDKATGTEREKIEGFSQIKNIISGFTKLPFGNRKQKEEKKELGGIIKEAVEATAMDPRSEKSRMLRFLGNEYLQTRHPKHRSRLAGIAESIKKGDSIGAKRDIASHMLKVREAALRKINDPEIARLVRKLVPESIANPEEMKKARAAIEITSNMRDNLGLSSRIPYLGNKNTAAAATKIYSRALKALEQGNYGLASTQANLAEGYVKARAPREEIETLSARIELDQNAAASVGAYAALNAAVLRLRAILPFPRTPGRSAIEGIIRELEITRKKISSGSSIGPKGSDQSQLLGEILSTSQQMAIVVGASNWNARGAVAEVYERALRSIFEVDGRGVAITDAAPLMNSLPRKADRETLLKACRDFSDGLISKEKFGMQLLISRARATYEKAGNGSTGKNLTAYFDLATLALRGNDLNEAKLLLDIASLYGKAIGMQALNSAQRNERTQTIEFVHRSIGDFSKDRNISSGKRLVDGNILWKPQTSLPKSASALLSNKTLAEALGGGSIEEGISAMKRISSDATLRSLAIEKIRFEQKAQKLEGTNTQEAARLGRQYDAEQKRLNRRADAMSRNGQGEMGASYKNQTAIVDRKKFIGLVGEARSLYADGIRDAQESVRLRDSSGGDKNKIIEAKKLAVNATRKIVSAEKALAALSLFDRSVRGIDTINRENGRSEIFGGVAELLRIGKEGISADLAGSRRLAIANINVGKNLILDQEAMKKSRDFGVWRAKRDLRDANIAQARMLIGRLIDSLPAEKKEEDFGIPKRTMKEAIIDRVKNAGNDVKELALIYAQLSQITGCKSGKDRTGTISLYFDIVANELGYRKTTTLYKQEKIEAADAARERLVARIRLGAMASGNRITDLEFKNSIANYRQIEETSKQKLGDPKRNLIEEVISHVPPELRNELRKEIDNLKPGATSSGLDKILERLKNAKDGSFVGAKIYEQVKNGKPVYYDADKIEKQLSEAARVLGRGGVRAAAGLMNKIRNDSTLDEMAQRKDIERYRYTYIANNMEIDANNVGELIFEKIGKNENQRIKAEGTDRNKLIQPVAQAFADSLIRSSKEYDKAAEASEKARDAIKNLRDANKLLVRPPPELVAAILNSLPRDKREISIEGRSARERLDGIAESRTPETRDELSRIAFLGLAKRPEDLKNAIERLRKEGTFDPVLMVQLDSIAANASVGEIEKNRVSARKASLFAIRDMQSDLRLADNVQRIRQEESANAKDQKWAVTGYRTTHYTHREHAARSAEFALAVLKNDGAFLDLLVGGARVPAPIFEGRSAERPWHARAFGKGPESLYVTVHSSVNRLGRQKREISFHDEMIDLGIARNKELRSYLIGDSARAEPQLIEQAKKEVELKLAQVGVRTIPDPRIVLTNGDVVFIDGQKLRKLDLGEKETALVERAYNAFTALKEQREGGILHINTSWAGANQNGWLNRIDERLDKFYRSGSIVTRNEKDILKSSEKLYLQGVPLELKNDGYHDDDKITNKFNEGMQGAQSTKNVVVSGVKLTAAGLGFAFSPATGGVSGALAGYALGGEQYVEAVKYLEQSGGFGYMDWKQKGYFGFQLSLARLTNNLPMASELVAARMAQRQAFAEIGVAATTAERTGLALGQGLTKYGSLYLVAGGTAQAAIQSPQLLAAVKEGKMTWWEAGANIFQAALPLYQTGAHAYRTSLGKVPKPRSGVRQTLEAVIIGTPFDTPSARAAALANAEFRKLPPLQREAYERYVNTRGLKLTPEAEAAMLSRYVRMYERGEVNDFTQFAARNHISGSELSAAERMHAMSRRKADIVNEVKAPEEKTFHSLLDRFTNRDARTNDASREQVKLIGNEYLGHIKGSRGKEAEFFDSLKGLNQGQIAKRLVEHVFERMGLEKPLESSAEKIANLQFPKFALKADTKERLLGDLVNMERKIRLAAPGDTFVERWRTLVNKTFNEIAKNKGDYRELIKASKAIDYLVSIACENPAKMDIRFGLIEFMPDPVRTVSIIRKAGAMMAKDVSVSPVENFPQQLRESMIKAFSGNESKDKILSLLDVCSKSNEIGAMFTDAGYKISDIKALAERGEIKSAINRLNSVLNSKGLVVLERYVENQKELIVVEATHIVNYKGSSKLRGVLAKFPAKSEGGFYDPNHQMIVLNSEAHFSGGGPKEFTYVKEIYLHELQHLFDHHSGFDTLASLISKDSTEYLARVEATALARGMLGRMAVKGSKPDAIINEILEGAARNDNWSGGWERIRDSLGIVPGKPEPKLKDKLKAFIDREYSETTGGLGFREIFSQRKSPRSTEPQSNEVNQIFVRKLSGQLKLDLNLKGMPAGYNLVRFENSDGRRISLNDAPPAVPLKVLGKKQDGVVYEGVMPIDNEIRNVDIKVYNNPKAPFQLLEEWGGKISSGNINEVKTLRQEWYSNAWKDRYSAFKNDLGNANVFSELGLGPKSYGAVKVGGNFAIATESVNGLRLQEMSPARIKENLGMNKGLVPGIYVQIKEKWQKLIDEGYDMKNFDFKVLSSDQNVGGRAMKKGEVVFINSDSLIRVSELKTERLNVKSEDYQGPVSARDRVKEVAKLIKDRLKIEE